MTNWDEIFTAIGMTLGGDRDQGRQDLHDCWSKTTQSDHAQRCVLAHYLADLESDLVAEVGWEERALASFAHVRDADLAPAGIPAATAMAPSLYLNLGDGYLRQGRSGEARQQLDAGLSALQALPIDGYGTMIRRGLAGLKQRLEEHDVSQPDGMPLSHLDDTE